jgi:pSer/pThr/pTyr-binding forkhead associated (FHA) protein
MTDQALDILKLVLLALLYLFFARVLWAVWSEVRQPANARGAVDYQPPAAPAGAPTAAKQPKPPKGKGGTPGRLVILEPKERRGTTVAVTAAGPVTIGREPDNTIVITDDSFISGHHARVALIGTNVVVDDLASKNGTYLNGSPISHQRTVHSGDRIQVGYTVLEAQ